jgi:hypothetical protein
VTSCALTAALTATLQGTVFTAGYGAIPIHLVMAAALGIAAWYGGETRGLLECAVIGLAGLYCFAAETLHPVLVSELPGALIAIYPLLVIGLLALSGYLAHNHGYYAAAGVITTTWLATVGVRIFEIVRRYLLGADHIAVGLLFFLLAIIISLAKAGAFRPRVAPEEKPL